MGYFIKFATVTAGAVLITVGVYGQGGTASAAGAAANSAAKPAIGRDTSPLNAENSLEIIKPPTPAEEKAYKAFKKFETMSNLELAAKAQSGEDFVKKYPSTSYTSFVYAFLTVAYIQNGALDKAQAAAEKGLQLDPKDYRTMAVLSQAIARLVRDGSPDATAQLAKSESYGKGAIAGIATFVKPDGMSDAHFAALKSDTLNMAHGGLGLVLLHRNDYGGAISELERAISLGPNDDPTNYYLLGVAYQNSGKSQQAAAAFEKCAAVKGNLQSTCATGLQQAKQDAAHQTSPK